MTSLSPAAEEEVLLHFKFFLRTGQKRFARYLERSAAYLPYIQQVFAAKGLPADIAYLALVESGFNPLAVSPAGATGLWQFMPKTGDHFGLARDWWLDERRDPYKATHAAAEYLLRLHGMFNDWSLAIAAYNAGEGRIMRALESTGATDFFDLWQKNSSMRRRDRLKDETLQYVPKLVAVTRIMHQLRLLGFDAPDYSRASTVAPLELSGGVDLLGLAKAMNLTWDEFAQYNPAFLRTVTPPTRPVTVYVPIAHRGQAMAYLDMPESRSYEEYKVARGDTLQKISKATGVPAEVIAQVNNVSQLKTGQVIILPPMAENYFQAEERTQEIARGMGTYKVKAGDSPYSIARAHKVPLDTLLAANGLNKNSKIQVGQTLYIPGKDGIQANGGGSNKTYKVQSGDTISSIARKLGVNTDKLLKLNKLTKNSIIRPGDVLRVP